MDTWDDGQVFKKKAQLQNARAKELVTSAKPHFLAK
jgi:hypothetical protein